jgi:beta-phosphoglucomutase-like phosphatase (HAD superfamily)
MDLRNKKYILWDHDGVLVDTEKWYFEATRKALAELGIQVPLSLYLTFMEEGRSLWTLAAEHGIPQRAIEKHKARRNACYQGYLQKKNIEIPWVIRALEKLSRHFAMAIVTTSKKEDFELIHRGRQIVRYMDFVLTVEDYAKAKPDPEPYMAALRRYRAVPEEAVVIEDSGRGLKSAVAAGIDCIIVENAFTRTHDFSSAAATLRNLDELCGLLLEGTG